jgi:MoxR-like ATPase
MADEDLSKLLSNVQNSAIAIKNNIARVIIGKTDVIDLLLVALFGDGHILI